MFTWLRTQLENWRKSSERRWWMGQHRQAELIRECGKRIPPGEPHSFPRRRVLSDLPQGVVFVMPARTGRGCWEVPANRLPNARVVERQCFRFERSQSANGTNVLKGWVTIHL